MKIALVTGPFNPFPPGPAGAVERLNRDLAACFAARGHKVLLLGRTSAGQMKEEHQGSLTLRRVGGLSSTRSLAANLAKDLLYSVRMLRQLPADADIWSLNAFWLPVLATWRRRGKGGPAIVVNAQRYPKGQFRRLYGRVDHVVAVSTAVGEAVKKEAAWADKRTTVILNPIDLRHFHAAVPRTRDQPGVDKILFTGRLHPQKGVDLLVQACRLLHEEGMKLRLCLTGPWLVTEGGGGEAYVARLRELAGALPLDIPGAIQDRAKLAALLASAQVYVYPSIDERGEALGVAPMEAMAVRTPVILSQLDCFSDYLVPEQTGLNFDHRNPDAVELLAAQLRRLLGDPALAARLGEAGAACMPQYDNERCAERYVELFSRLSLSRRASTGATS